MAARMRVREATVDDLEAAARLLAQLGYPSPEPEVLGRLEVLLSSEGDRVLLAEDGEVAGLLSLHLLPLLAEGRPFARITALVVDERRRAGGVAQRLLQEAEEVARSWGCDRLEVSCGRRPERERAHRFYPSQGFRDANDVSARYWKDLLHRCSSVGEAHTVADLAEGVAAHVVLLRGAVERPAGLLVEAAGALVGLDSPKDGLAEASGQRVHSGLHKRASDSDVPVIGQDIDSPDLPGFGTGVLVPAGAHVDESRDLPVDLRHEKVLLPHQAFCPPLPPRAGPMPASSGGRDHANAQGPGHDGLPLVVGDHGLDVIFEVDHGRYVDGVEAPRRDRLERSCASKDGRIELEIMIPLP